MKLSLWLPATIVLVGSLVCLFSFPVREYFSEELASVEAAAPQLPKPVTILAFGDLMLDRSVRQKIESKGAAYPFARIADLFVGHDIVVANAEGVFTASTSVSVDDHSILRFTFATSSLPTLHSLGFSVLSQANNHALDFGWSGLRTSKEQMTQNNISSFGDPINKDPGPLYVPVRDEKVAFVGYMQLFNPDASSTLVAIRKARAQGAFVIVYPHWGEEYNVGTTSAQTKLAHQFIDAGADVVLGSHPHVVEPVEIYRDKAIFYSMGNFVFDQHWNKSVSNGIAVDISFTKKEVSYRVIPYVINDMQPTPTSTVSSFVLQR